jgi:GTPase SAR1 family protein
VYAQQHSTLQVMNKLASNFDVSARSEPVCIVFEGKAGSGKSTLMNKVIDYLVKKDYSIYNHNCPSVDAAKDFYDDYIDQDVFVMDDVGQQGVSQWRQIINFVSPVKFPLDCAEARHKNTKFFNSKLLLLTTNHFSDLHSFTKTDCIAEPSALFRRCHVLNFDEILFSKGKMTGRVKYKKFDHLTHKWHTAFIGPQSDCKLNSTCPVDNTNKAVAWVYSMISIFLDKQKEMYDGNALTKDDEIEIDNLVNEFRGDSEAEEFHDAILSQSRFSALADLTKDNVDIFREYLSYLKDQFLERTILAYEFLRTDPSVHTSVSAISTGILKGIFHALTAMAGHKLYEYIVGDTSPQNLSENTFREQSVKGWQSAHGDYVKRTLPSMIMDTSNDTLMDISQQQNEIGTRISSLRSKMRIIELISKSGYKNVAQGIVSGRRIVVQCHSYDTFEGVANIFRDWHCYSNNSYECNNIPFKVIKEWKEYDMAIIEISLTVPIYKDATHSLFTKDIELDIPFNARRMFFVNSQAALSLDNNFTVNLDSFQVQTPSLNRSYTVQPGAGIEYSITAPGLCGSLLVDAEFGLCGLHVAGTSANGFAFVLPKRVLRELKSLLSFKESQHFEIKLNDEENYSGIKLFNDIFPSKRPLQKTTLNKSELHDGLTAEALEVGEKLPPNFLSFGSKTLPEIAKKSLKPIPYISDKAIEFGKKCIRQFFVEFDDLEDTEVIKGLKEEELSGLNKQSVNGFGYDKDKTLYIDFAEGEITPLFQSKINEFKQNCKHDQTTVEGLLFYEAFKDELRLKEKINKPRSFRVAPLHHTFLVKKYVGKLFAHCKKNMWKNQIAIGMNPYKHWNRLYQKLKKAFINFDGDFGNWDGGAPAQVQDAISDLVMEFYKGSEPETLRVLLDSMVRTFVLIKEKLVLTTHSMPSGCWVTAFFNSLINRFLTALVLFIEKEKEGLVATVEEFNELIDFVLGDDKICGAPAHLAKYFNALTMKNFSESIGMKYTDGDKGDIKDPSKALTDCVFLKRGFKWHSGLETIVGPLSLNTMVNSLRYQDSSREYDDSMEGKMTAFQFEIFLHDNERLKTKVLEDADTKHFFYHKFDDDHIKKTMMQDNTYAEVMIGLGKNISNFL